MNLTKLIAVIPIFILKSALAFNCDEQLLRPVQIIKSPEAPSYFFKPHPTDNKVSYIGYLQNKLIGNDGIAKNIPGKVDGVFSPDGALYSTPTINGLAFYEYPSFKLLLLDEKSRGDYQSIGVLGKASSVITYRTITSQGMRDYIYSTTTKKITAIGNKVSKYCSNLNITTPMLSGNGQFLAYLDKRSKTTKIARINKDSTCEVVLDLGYATGKVSFSPDMKKIAFHVDKQSNGNSDVQIYFSGVNGDVTKDVYAIDLNWEDPDVPKAKFISKITTTVTANTGNYYPAFKANGNLVYVNKDEQGNYAFVEVNPEEAIRLSLDYIDDINEHTKSFWGFDCDIKTTEKLIFGLIWAEACKITKKLQDKDYLLFSINVDNSNCTKLINEYFDKVMMKLQNYKVKFSVNSGFDEVTKASLLKACPSVSNDHYQLNKTVKLAAPKTGKEIIFASCAACHFGSPFIDFNNLTAVQRKKALEKVGNGSMPKGNALSTKDKETLIKYLTDLVIK
ncbi:MAG: hypothetical protein ACOYL6_08900 [Bacteriovoracaceae bacterium]